MPIQLSGSGSITGVSTLTSLASLDVTGSVSVGGTLTYDDVTNIDSVGIITARSDVHVGSALSVTGISTFGNSLHVTSGSVGIGTDNPSAYFSDANDVVLLKTDDCGITIASGASQKGTIAFADGTTADQAYRGYIQYNHSTDSLQVATTGTERFRVTSTGNIGIGTENPESDQLLTIHGTSNYKAGIRLRQSSTNIFKLIPEGGTGNVYYDVYGITGSLIGDHIFRVKNGQEKLRITSSGSVGIGTDNPSQLLDVYNGNISLYAPTHEQSIRLRTDRGTLAELVHLSGDGALRLYTGEVTPILRTYISSYGNTYFNPNAGNVGIGTDNPDRLLHLSSNTNTRLKIATTSASSFGQLYLGDEEKFILGYRGSHPNEPHGLALKSTNSSGYISLFTGGDNERLRVTSAGKVGINNTDPQTTLNVQGTISTGRNLAREVGTVISYSSQFSTSRSASNVINGKKNYENGGNDWLTGSRDNANLVIDLGAQYDIDRVVIYNQNEYNGSRREVKRFNLEGSNDNSSWTLLIDDELGRSDAHEPNPGFSFRLPHVSSPGSLVDDDEGVSYRYWRFTMKDFHDTDGYGGIMEIELYGASNAVDSEVSTHSVVASDVYTQTLSAQRLAIGENGALGDFRARVNENVYINSAARFGQNISDSTGNASRHTGWRMYGYNPDGVNNRLQFTVDGFYGRKSFYYYFPNNTANQAIRFHSNRNSFWTCGFITINAQYSNQNAAGMLRYHFQHNANGTTSYGKTIATDVDLGNTSGNFQMSQSYSFKTWGSNGGSTTSHALELRHLTSTGNGCWVTIELYGNHIYNHIDDLYMTVGHTY